MLTKSTKIVAAGYACAHRNIIEMFVVYYVFMDVCRQNVKCDESNQQQRLSQKELKL